METIQKEKKRKDKKPLYLLAIFFVVFGLFIFLINIKPDNSDALMELQASYNKKDVKTVWDKHKKDLFKDETFLLEIRKKLMSLELSESELKDCISWLPPAPKSINIIVVPDLSRRITDTINNPKQISNDKLVLKTIWNSFKNYSKLKQDTNDKLIVEPTDIDQAKGQFDRVANLLQFDLSDHKSKSNRLYFTSGKDLQFIKSINEMYRLAKEKPLGADYRFYLKRYLADHLKKSTIFVNYTNKIIFITDGYLEAEGKTADTKIFQYEKGLHNAVSIGNVLDFINQNGLNIPVEHNIDLSNSQILICEVNERKSGKGFDFEILKAYWEDWFKRMNVKNNNFSFIKREQANNLTIKKIDQFINK